MSPLTKRLWMLRPWILQNQQLPQWCERERGDFGFARMRAMLVLFSAKMGGGGRRESLQKISGEFWVDFDEFSGRVVGIGLRKVWPNLIVRWPDLVVRWLRLLLLWRLEEERKIVMVCGGDEDG
ncbi:hypothetical protein KY285_011205 [Solanum tuberosum]|nr:hypothetical protein KY289_011773 [Solanum tuberosum]KAH0735498.1 hypothetical protein KY285_011205 [Solanum tuberosum]